MSSNKKLLARLFALNCALSGSYGESFEDMIYMSREHIRDISISLILEIRELEEKGYTYEEILNMINECNFSEYNLTDEEKGFLKRDAQKTLKIVFKRGE